MSRSNINALITMQSLRFSDSNPAEPFMRDVPEHPGLKNVCAKVSTSLSDSIDDVCDLLNISKRRFIQDALIDAVDEANRIMEQEGVFATQEIWASRQSASSGSANSEASSDADA